MRPARERDVARAAGAEDIELVRVLEFARIAIRRGEDGIDIGALPDRHAFDLGILRGVAEGRRDRSLQAQRLVDRLRTQVALGGRRRTRTSVEEGKGGT